MQHFTIKILVGTLLVSSLPAPIAETKLRIPYRKNDGRQIKRSMSSRNDMGFGFTSS